MENTIVSQISFSKLKIQKMKILVQKLHKEKYLSRKPFLDICFEKPNTLLEKGNNDINQNKKKKRKILMTLIISNKECYILRNLAI